MADEPIEPKDFIYGVKVVDIGDLRIARGMTRRPRSACRHRSMVYDTAERRIWCEDCEQNVDPFDAFVLLSEHYATAMASLNRREKAISEAEQFAARSRAVKELDRVWRGRNMTPACPHCKGGLLPEDFANGVGLRINRKMERARRRRNGT